jgi:hypothetical protein
MLTITKIVDVEKVPGLFEVTASYDALPQVEEAI